MEIIRGYNSYARIAKVMRDDSTTQCDVPYELMRVSRRAISFKTDGLAFALDAQNERDRKMLASFEDGDIVTITSRGRVNKLYENAEHNATVYVTGRCNSNCRMCPCSDYERRTNDGMSSEWLETYIEMLPSDVSHVVVTGGEPTLKPSQFLLTMRLLADKFPNVETLLLTNGRAFSSSTYMHKMLSHCPRLLMVGIPVHGPNPRIHDYITQTGASFDQTCRGIENLLANDVAVEIRIVVSRLNVSLLEEIAELVAARFPGVAVVNFMGLETMGSCARNFKSVFIDYKQSWRYMEPAIAYLLKSGIDVQIYNYPLCTVDRGFWALCRQSITPHKVRFPQTCKGCSVKESCSGYFLTTMRMAKPSTEAIQLTN